MGRPTAATWLAGWLPATWQAGTGGLASIGGLASMDDLLESPGWLVGHLCTTLLYGCSYYGGRNDGMME